MGGVEVVLQHGAQGLVHRQDALAGQADGWQGLQVVRRVRGSAGAGGPPPWGSRTASARQTRWRCCAWTPRSYRHRSKRSRWLEAGGGSRMGHVGCLTPATSSLSIFCTMQLPVEVRRHLASWLPTDRTLRAVSRSWRCVLNPCRTLSVLVSCPWLRRGGLSWLATQGPGCVPSGTNLSAGCGPAHPADRPRVRRPGRAGVVDGGHAEAPEPAVASPQRRRQPL